MISAKKMESNAANAQKSTGPKTPEGKKKSSMNAVKHGFTARTVLLPSEDFGEFRHRMTGFFDALKPRNALEVFHAERAMYLSWQLERIQRAQAGRIHVRALTHVELEENRIALEVGTLVQKLLKPLAGRTAVFPFDARAAEGEDEGLATPELGEHPAQVVAKMEATGAGCRMLLQLWEELHERLGRPGGYWRAPERFRAFRLLGIHGNTSYMNMKLGSLLQACQVLDPETGSRGLVREIWGELVPAAKMAELEAMYQDEVRHKPVPDQETARQYLVELIGEQTARLEQKAELSDRCTKYETEVASFLTAVDDSKAGRLNQRYEMHVERMFNRHLDEIDKRHSAKWQESHAYSGLYYKAPASWLTPLETSVPGNTSAARGENGEKARRECKNGSTKSQVSNPKEAPSFPSQISKESAHAAANSNGRGTDVLEGGGFDFEAASSRVEELEIPAAAAVVEDQELEVAAVRSDDTEEAAAG
jgi:hypothetical protein